MTDAVAGLAYAGLLVAVATLVVSSSRREEARRGLTSLLLAYVVVVTGVAGLTRRDLWPFSSWQLMVGEAPTSIGVDPDPESLLIVGVDAGGREHLIDYRAWQPLNLEDMARWLVTDLEGMDPSSRREVADHLLDMADRARAAARDGRAPGSFDRWWGRLSAPYHLLHPRRWADPDRVSEQPFVGLRLYREHYDLEAAAAGRAPRLELLYDSTGPGP